MDIQHNEVLHIYNNNKNATILLKDKNIENNGYIIIDDFKNKNDNFISKLNNNKNLKISMIKYPLIKNNILREDLDNVIKHLSQDDPILTNGPKVREFEEAWNNWLIQQQC